MIQINDRTEAPTTAWPGDLEAMNQLAETTTLNEITTIMADTTENPTTIFPLTSKSNQNEKLESTTPSAKSEESTTIETITMTPEESTTMINDSTTMNEPISTTTFDSPTTTENPHDTTTETTTFESTTIEFDDRIDPKVIASLLG